VCQTLPRARQAALGVRAMELQEKLLQLPAELDEMQMESNMLFGEGMSELAVNLTEVDAAEQDKATKAYQDAYSLILDEKWPQAQKAFHDFVRQYPKNRYTDAAQFWYCYYME
jgi:TolA-binding protein